MNREKRRDLHRALTTALGVTAAVLVYLHFTGREKAMDEARTGVRNAYELARNVVARRVGDLRARLLSWERDAPAPEGFTKVALSGTGDPPGMRPLAPDPGLPAERFNAHAFNSLADRPADRFWVHTFSPETDLTQVGDVVLDGNEEEPYGVTLNFAGGGKGTISVSAILADPPAPGAAPVALEVFLKKGVLPREPLGPRTVAVASAAAPEKRDYPVVVDDSIRTVKHTLILQSPAGSPRVRVSWSVRIGETQSRQVVVGVLRTFPERESAAKVLRYDHWVEEKVHLPPEAAMVLGYAPLEDFAEALRDAGLLRTEEWGDRLYLTDVSGTVAEAIPDFPEKIRSRARMEGRTSLSSPATQRLKVRGAGVEEYEGFAKDQVVGAFGPLDVVNGGLLVEREEKKVLGDFRGIQAWHVAALLFGGLLLWPAVPPVVRRIREDTELPRLLSYARGFLPHFVAIVAAATLYSLGQGFFAYQGKVVMDEVIVTGDSSAYGRLWLICRLLVGVSCGMFVVNWVKEYLGKVIQNRLVMEIRCALCDKIVGLPMAFHSRQRSGDLLSRIGNDVAETNRGLEMLFGDVISDPILIVTLVGTAFYINWRLALVIFVGLPVLLLPISYFGARIKKHARRRQARKADVTHTISQMLAGIKVVKAFRMEEHESRRIRGISENFLVEALRVARAQVTSKEFLEFFSNVSGAVVLALGGYLVLERQVTVGDLSAFVLVITKMYKSTKNLTGNYNKMQESLAGTERIFEILDQPDTMADHVAARALVRPRREIAFERVSFRYAEDGPWVLREVSFRVPVGSSVALVGPTGTGKSTVLDLVARFYDPQEGLVTVDDVDLRGYSRTSLLSHVAMVTQEAFLFNASIAENIRYGRPGASPTEVEAAARAAFIHDEILRQPDGYETVVGERGSRLSGGQRQRITIARAILKDPPILLLDEATSALDSRSEKMVQEALSNLMKDRTTFVIAHRLSTIQGVDRILVIDGGRLVEQGTHEELLRIPGGHYRHLHEIQFGSALRDEGPADAAAG